METKEIIKALDKAFKQAVHGRNESIRLQGLRLIKSYTDALKSRQEHKNMKTIWIIKDWASNVIKIKGRPYFYDSFEDAEEVLSEELGEDYEECRQEYEIVERTQA